MKIELNCPLSTYLHTHRLVHLSAFIPEACLSSIWLLLQRFITGQHARLRDCKMLSPKWDIYITPPSSQVGGDQEEAERQQNQREWKTAEKSCFLNMRRCYTHGHTGAMTAYTRPTQIKPPQIPAWMAVPPLAERLLALDGSKSQLSSGMWTEDYPCFRDSPTPIPCQLHWTQCI